MRRVSTAVFALLAGLVLAGCDPEIKIYRVHDDMYETVREPFDASTAKDARPGDRFVKSRFGVVLDAPDKPQRGARLRYPSDLHAFEAARRVRMEGDVPVYRLEFIPWNMPPSVLESWGGLARMTIDGFHYYAPMPEDRRLRDDGLLVTDWVFCPACAGRGLDGARGTSAASDRARAAFAVEGEPDFKRVRLIFGAEEPDLLYFSTGETALREARRMAAGERLEVARLAEPRREYFRLRREYRPSRPVSRLNEVCEDYLMASSEWRKVFRGGDDYVAALARLQRRMPRLLDCAEAELARIDWATRGDELARIAGTERALAEAGEIPAAERFEVRSLREEIENVETWYERQRSEYLYAANHLPQLIQDERDVARHRARQQAAADAAWARLAADPLGDWRRRTQAQMADMADFNSRVQGMVDRPPRTLPSTVPSAPSTQDRADARRREAEANRAEMETRAAMAEAEERARQEEAQERQQAASAAPDPAGDETPEAQPTWTEALAGEDEPRRGGMEGCVEVIETRKSTGSSAMSSCSYDEPDRPSMTLVYQNNCGFPVHIETRIAMDTGGSDTWTEYGVKPGRRRSTADLCGLIAYEFSYEEED
ncbi:hypothetical protein [Albimonas pacifica]|uniref:Uncharacterized protein n=1 Tax=Albimonas pacifica TaxID=1114924 RepID=A0A1I3K4H3_9RHOB|nr:hypothetical protein [Albimonas pacifica]SFI67326.1 hypothetical protein SAMN05216258_108292 [Albimonas pacifica]